MSRSLPAAVGGGFGLAVGVLRGARQLAPALLVDADATTATLGWLLVAVNVLAFVVSPVLAAVAGYWLGGRVDLSTRWPPVLLTVAAAGFVGALVGDAAFVVLAPDVGSLTAGTPPLAVVALWEALAGTTTLALAVFAGAAMRTFRQT